MTIEFKQLGPYSILKRLGFGGMCEVYLAQRFGASGFQKQVALKVLLPEHRGQSSYERQLILEAVTGAKLNHPSIAQVHDLGIDQGVYFIVMEYIHGQDLRTIMHHNKPPTAIALYIIAQVARALHYLHTFEDEQDRWLGLVHRDVSPSNILITQDGDLKLIDFGITKATQSTSKTHGRIRKGKYAYMSPEYINGQPLEANSDLFGLGVMFMELLSGRRPFDGGDIMSTMEKIRDDTRPDLLGLDEHLRPIVEQCLRKHPQDRFHSARDLYDTLVALPRDLYPIANAMEVHDWMASYTTATRPPLKKSEATL